MSSGWRPIEDLPERWPEMRPAYSTYLAEIAPLWRRRQEELAGSAALRQFNERLMREWAIETGIIEKLYTIDRGLTQLLIEKGINESLLPYGFYQRPVQQVTAMIRDHQETLEGLFAFVARRRSLSTAYIRELHSTLTRHQDQVEAVDSLGRPTQIPLLRGEWKRQPNNPTRPDGTVHEYCPPVHVAAEMDRLVDLHLAHVAAEVPPELEAAWLHHRFTQIHPFQDGNGRVARALATLVLLRGWLFPLIVPRERRGDYLDALERADAGDLRPFADLTAELQVRLSSRALAVTDELPAAHVTDLARALRERRDRRRAETIARLQALSDRARGREPSRGEAEAPEESQETCVPLPRALLARLTETAADMLKRRAELVEAGDLDASTSQEAELWFQHLWPDRAARDLTSLLGLDAQDLEELPEDRALVIALGDQDGFLLVLRFFRLLGTARASGDPVVLGAALLLFRRKDDHEISRADPSEYDYLRPATERLFQCVTTEPTSVVEARFRDWLDEAIIVGLRQCIELLG